MASNLHCASCGRTDIGGTNFLKTITYQGVKWCTSCAAIKQTAKGETYISAPSPGRVYEGLKDDPLSAWEDCYTKKPKKRILVKKAKTEIQKAWEGWDVLGDVHAERALPMQSLHERPLVLSCLITEL
jgi:hypothetical protein